MKKYLIVILCLVLLIQPMSIYAVDELEGDSFNDMEGHWAKEVVDKHYQMGMVKGYPDDTFKPDEKIIRSEIVALINRYFGLKVEADENFQDVLEGQWFSKDALKAKYYQYVKEVNLNPEDALTREDAVFMLDVLIDVDEEESVKDKLVLVDLDDTSQEGKKIIGGFVEKGYINGYEDGTFRPDEAISRAEILTIFEEMLGYIVESQDDIDNMPQGTTKITIVNPGIVIEDMNIDGDIYIAPGANGQVFIKNTAVNGKIIISGGSSDQSIFLEDIEADMVLITKDMVGPTVQIAGRSSIGTLKVKSVARIIMDGDSSVRRAEINDKLDIQLNEKSSIVILKANAEILAQGEGNIINAYIGSKNVVLKMKPSYVKVEKNAGTAMISGEEVTSRNDGSHHSSGSTGSTGDTGSGQPDPADVTAPTIDNKVIISNGSSESSLDLSWTKATDNETDGSELAYIIYYSTINNIDTVENMEANGTKAGETFDIDSKSITGLEADTEYYFNIIVKDKVGNKTAYTSASEMTDKAEGEISNSIIGAGSTDDPFVIMYIEDLVEIAKNTNEEGTIIYSNASYELGSNLDFTSAESYRNPEGKDVTDIDEDGEIDETLMNALKKGDESDPGKGFKPIESRDNSTFDGKNHSISNLYINRGLTSNVGLFSYLATCSISNLNVIDAEINGDRNTGIIAGNNGGVIMNCFASGKVNGSRGVGGLIGNNDDGEITNCSTNVEVNGYRELGGLIGQDSGGIIENCYSISRVTGNSESYCAGGLTGFNYKTTIKKCYAISTVTGNYQTGGLVGSNYMNSEIADSYSISSVTGNYNVGGLAGDCYSDGIIRNCYSMGTVTGNNSVGGLVGSSYWGGMIYNSIALSEIVIGNTSDPGRVVSSSDSESVLINNYANINMVVKEADVIKSAVEGIDLRDGKGITEFDYSNASFYTDPIKWFVDGENDKWDFNNVWEIKFGASRPTLKGVSE